MVSGCWYTPPLFFVALVPVLGVLFVADPESPNIFGVCLGLKSEEMLKILNEEDFCSAVSEEGRDSTLGMFGVEVPTLTADSWDVWSELLCGLRNTNMRTPMARTVKIAANKMTFFVCESIPSCGNSGITSGILGCCVKGGIPIVIMIPPDVCSREGFLSLFGQRTHRSREPCFR